MTPRATYRLQLHAGFTFDDAAGIVPYLARLGISHLYCSPILQAAPGSTHGYDLVDHSRLSDERGGADGFERLRAAAAGHGLSLVLDIVPNHMALAGAANRWWWDVLEHGPSSRFADHFDIDWTPVPGTVGPSVLMPILGDHYGRVLEAGEFSLGRRGDSLVVRYYEHELPLSPESTARVERLAIERGVSVDDVLTEIQRDPDALDELLSEQNYRLAYWRVASDELDYRRFFDITTLVGVRVEQASVFDDTHALVLDLVRSGSVSGLRIDHVDGLRDPLGYLTRLRASAPDVWLTVEKILADDEALPAAWPVDGTTGYEFANRVTDLFVDPNGVRTLIDHAASWTGEVATFAEVAHAAQQQVMRRELAAEVERVTGLLDEVCRERRRHRDHTRRELRDVVRELASTLDVYRTYVAPDRAVDSIDRDRITELVAAVAEARPDIDTELLDLLRRVLVLDEPGTDANELAVRFQQLTAPVTAKGIEDTAFYRWVPLLARNEVGSDPGAIGRGVDPFHDHNAEIASRWPASMLALSTHDTKRSADVRARLCVLSQIAGAWTDTTDAWRKHNENRVEGWDDPAMELTLYQTLVGAWPIDSGRVEAAMLKAAKEAKVHTSWRDADETYEANLQAFVRGVMSDASFVSSIEAFLDEHDLVHYGRVLSLAQLALQLTSPGVPDTYQGDEVWDLSLVDPDNRRPVDFKARMALLDDIAGAAPETVLAREDDGAPKVWLLHRLLQHRRTRPDLYERAEYEPLIADGPYRDDIVAFARDGLVTVAPRHIGGIGAAWARTRLTLPPGSWTDVLAGGPARSGPVDLRALFERFPVAVLERHTP